MSRRRRVAETTRLGRPVDTGKLDAIESHARRLFTERGFSGTNMDELATAAGVSKATIYNRFGSKEALFETVLRTLLWQLPTPVALMGDLPTTDLRERLCTVARAACGLATSPLLHDLQRMLALPMEGAGRTADSFWAECLAPYQHAFGDLLRAEAGQGRLRIDDVEVASSQFFSLAASEPFIRMVVGDATRVRTEDFGAHVRNAVDAFLRIYQRSD